MHPWEEQQRPFAQPNTSPAWSTSSQNPRFSRECFVPSSSSPSSLSDPNPNATNATQAKMNSGVILTPHAPYPPRRTKSYYRPEMTNRTGNMTMNLDMNTNMNMSSNMSMNASTVMTNEELELGFLSAIFEDLAEPAPDLQPPDESDSDGTRSPSPSPPPSYSPSPIDGYENQWEPAAATSMEAASHPSMLDSILMEDDVVPVAPWPRRMYSAREVSSDASVSSECTSSTIDSEMDMITAASTAAWSSHSGAVWTSSSNANSSVALMSAKDDTTLLSPTDPSNLTPFLSYTPRDRSMDQVEYDVDLDNQSCTGSYCSSSTSRREHEDPNERGAATGTRIDRKLRRRQQVASSARRHRARKKNELMDLREEVHVLRRQFESLRLRRSNDIKSPGMMAWEDTAMAQRLERQHAEELNAQLRRALLEQSFFVVNLQSLMSGAPNGMMDLNYAKAMHTRLQLCSGALGREQILESLFTSPKVQLAFDMLTRHTGSLEKQHHVMSVQVVEESQMFGTTVMSVSAFDTLDLLRVFRHARDAVWVGASAWPGFEIAESDFTVAYARKDQTLVYGSQRAKYRWRGIQYGNEDEDNNKSNPEMWLEMPVVTFATVTKEHAIMLWDYVDEDPLLPIDEKTDIARQAIGGFVVRREVCEDGQERVVVRMIATKLHHVRHDVNEAMSKFVTSTHGDTKLMCGQVIYEKLYQTVMRR